MADPTYTNTGRNISVDCYKIQQDYDADGDLSTSGITISHVNAAQKTRGDANSMDVQIFLSGTLSAPDKAILDTVVENNS